MKKRNLLEFEKSDDIEIRRNFSNEVIICHVESAIRSRGQSFWRQKFQFVGWAVQAGRGQAVGNAGLAIAHDGRHNLKRK